MLIQSTVSLILEKRRLRGDLLSLHNSLEGLVPPACCHGSHRSSRPFGAISSPSRAPVSPHNDGQGEGGAAILGQTMRGKWVTPEEMGMAWENTQTCKLSQASQMRWDPGSPQSDAISSGLRRNRGVTRERRLSMALGQGRAGQGLRSWGPPAPGGNVSWPLENWQSSLTGH